MILRDRRDEYRTCIDIDTVPFLGFREHDWFSFEYYPLDVSRSGLRIGLQPAHGTASLLKSDDVVTFNLSLRFDDRVFDHGRIMWFDQDQHKGFVVCGIHLPAEKQERGKRGHFMSTHYLSLSLETADVVFETDTFDSANELFLHIIEESLVVRQNLLRAVDKIGAPAKNSMRPHENAGFPTAFVKEAVRKDADRLRAYLHGLRKELSLNGEARALLEFADLRRIMRSDVYNQLAQVPGLSLRESGVVKTIKECERQLSVNYNNIVLLWLGYLACEYQNFDVPSY